MIASNAVIDSSGRLAARKGWVNQTTSTIASSPNLLALHEYVDNTGAVTLVTAGNSKLYESSDNGATWTDRTGAVAVTADNWQFQNFNGKVIGAQASHALVVKTAGNFAAVVATSGSVPTTPIAVLCAYGRVWCVGSDFQTIYYSALLDETKWAVVDGAGTIDMRTVWTLGTDTLVTVKAFSSRLIAFGKRHIVIWSDGKGSALGVDPTNLYVEDCLENNGTSSRDSVQAIGEGDLLFLGAYGIQSLSRIVQEKKAPLTDLTKNSRQYFSSLVFNSGVDKTKIKAAYSPEEGLYIMSVPGATTTFVADMRQPLPDASYRIFEWPQFYPTSLTRRTNGDLLLGFNGKVGKYSGYQDNGSPYSFVWACGYLDMQDVNIILKSLKSLRLLAATSGAYTVILRWGFDFAGRTNTATLTYTGAPGSEYGSGEYGIAEFGGSDLAHTDRIPGSGTGQYLSLGVETTIDGSSFAIQTLHALYEQGHIA